VLWHLHLRHAIDGQLGWVLACRVEVVSTNFEGKSLVQRHKSIYALLDDELNSGLHALSLKVKTPKEAGL
jgi:BolA-like protein 1